jgi:hypothetical protein
MPVTVIHHEDGSSSVVETDEQGAHHQFDINADGSQSERGQTGEGESHQESVERYSRPGDTGRDSFDSDHFEDGMGGVGGGGGGPRRIGDLREEEPV